MGWEKVLLSLHSKPRNTWFIKGHRVPVAFKVHGPGEWGRRSAQTPGREIMKTSYGGCTEPCLGG